MYNLYKNSTLSQYRHSSLNLGNGYSRHGVCSLVAELIYIVSNILEEFFFLYVKFCDNCVIIPSLIKPL